jgi:hypothetical protein
VRLSPDARMLQWHGVVLESARDTAKVLGLSASRVELRRKVKDGYNDLGDSLYRYIAGTSDFCPPSVDFFAAVYLPSGARKRRALAYDCRRIDNIEKWVSEYIGDIVYFLGPDTLARLRDEK